MPGPRASPACGPPAGWSLTPSPAAVLLFRGCPWLLAIVAPKPPGGRRCQVGSGGCTKVWGRLLAPLQAGCSLLPPAAGLPSEGPSDSAPAAGTQARVCGPGQTDVPGRCSAHPGDNPPSSAVTTCRAAPAGLARWRCGGPVSPRRSCPRCT